MNAFLKVLDKALAIILIVLMSVIVLDVTWQVFTRFILNNPSSYTEELARFLLIWIGILGASYTYRLKAHLGLDLLTRSLEPKKQALVEVLAQACCFTFALLVMVYGGFRLMALTLELNQVSAALGIKIGYVYSVLPVSGTLICIYSAVFFAQAAGRLTASETTAIHDNASSRL